MVATGPRWSPIYSTAESLYLCGASAVYGKTRRFTRSQFGPLTKVLKSESQFCDKRVLFALLFFTLLLLPQTHRDVHGALISFPSGSGDVRPSESYRRFTKIDQKRHRKYRACYLRLSPHSEGYPSLQSPAKASPGLAFLTGCYIEAS